LLTAGPKATEAAGSSDEAAVLQIDGRIVDAEQSGWPHAHRFSETGTVHLNTVGSGGNGTALVPDLVVRAVGVAPQTQSAAWVGHLRSWEWPSAASEQAVVEWDPRLSWIAPQAYQARVGIDDDEWRQVAARTGESGAILSAASFAGFRLFSSSDTHFEVVETYEDGTELIEMGLVLSPVLPGVEIEVKLIVGGVVFENGTVIRRLRAVDFNELGEATVRFLRPALAKTSVCHRVRVWEGPVLLGEYR
jgi:hypothetical protein